MYQRKIDLYEYFGVKRVNEKGGILSVYQHENLAEMKERKYPAMLIFPGGGYSYVSEREGEPVAIRFYEAGFNAFVLEYDVAPSFHCSTMLLQAGMAMLWLRRETANLSLEKNQIAAIGFSAGGHLCGCISFLWDDPILLQMFGEECSKIRPDLTLLSYPVVTSAENYCHNWSFKNFCGDSSVFDRYSLDKLIRLNVPPCFIWSTTTDETVPVENSVMLYLSLLKKKIPVELHIFGKGKHGLSVCNKEVIEDLDPSVAHVGHWLTLSIEFMREHGFSLF